MSFYPQDKIALFIDGANLYSASKALNLEIDYRKLLEEFRKRGVLMRAYYYTALVEGDDYSPIRPLVDWLDYNGYAMVTKTAREYVDAQGRKRWRGDMDIEIACDMMEMADHADHLVLFSGDGDFRRLIEAVQRKGCRVTLVSTVKSNPPMTSDELRRQVQTMNLLRRCDYLRQHIQNQMPETLRLRFHSTYYSRRRLSIHRQQKKTNLIQHS
jgi:uncharacterized LabA/DUF88 family protein